MIELPAPIEKLAARLAALPDVEAIALGGSRARGDERADSDWDLGVFYRGSLDVAPIRAFGLAGQVFEPHQWGPVINGGAWLEIDDHAVDLIYQDLDAVERWWRDADEGRFEIHRLVGYAAGIPTYNAVGALAVAQTVYGTLPRPEFSDDLRNRAPRIWRNLAAGALRCATAHARRHELTQVVTELGLAALSEAHARCAARGEWVLTEKGLLERAGLSAVHRVIDGPEKLLRRVQLVAEQLALDVTWGR
jgi:predicted nucleotidyltransferase